ncbi:hypothetical protein [Paracoccus marinaquae]|uniref:Uncharacterized protein n=1 Tax=Paracoccus marinaquae TaxID=2841926 RepID=A0ABS6AHF3_9RHOB|nr:hypothetical protein [Paracoccus marinaquae]MBU3029944.1 hypothetical protein [Paracoccus marinaquae]
MTGHSPTTRPRPAFAGPCAAAPVLAVLVLAGCMVAPPSAMIAPAPRTPAAAITSPYAPATTAPTAPTLPEVPAAPTFSGAVDGRTGMRQAAVVAVSGDAGSGYTVLFRPAQTEPASVNGVPGRLCGDTGVASSRTNSPGAGSAMPGVQIMIVKCGAAA